MPKAKPMELKSFTIYYSSLVPTIKNAQGENGELREETQYLPFRLGADLSDPLVDTINYLPSTKEIVIHHTDNSIFTFKLDGGSVVGYTLEYPDAPDRDVN